MSLTRLVIVGFRGPGGKIEKVTQEIPADWVTGELDALHEVYNNQRLRTKIAVAPDTVIWAQISDPRDLSQVMRVVRGS
jgi:hypothetical protein